LSKNCGIGWLLVAHTMYHNTKLQRLQKSLKVSKHNLYIPTEAGAHDPDKKDCFLYIIIPSSGLIVFLTVLKAIHWHGGQATNVFGWKYRWQMIFFKNKF